MVQICSGFSMEPADPKTYSPLALAFIGDGVFDLVIRTMVVCRANAPAHALHEEKAAIVQAAAQARLVQAIYDELSEEEQSVYRRGRNAKPHSIARNASMHNYRAATGFEALVGYLYLQNDMDRILYLVKTGLDKIAGEIQCVTQSQ